MKACIDAAIDNADWPKRTWDLPDDPTQAAAILTMGNDDIEAIKRLPVIRWNPERAAPVLREARRLIELNRFYRENPPAE